MRWHSGSGPSTSSKPISIPLFRSSNFNTCIYMYTVVEEGHRGGGKDSYFAMNGLISWSFSSRVGAPESAASSASSASVTSSSYSSYTMFFNRTGMSRVRKGRRTPGSTAASQNALQNSHDSRATPSSPSCNSTKWIRYCLVECRHQLWIWSI